MITYEYQYNKEKLEKDIETQKQAISQLEDNTEVSSTCPLPLPTPEPKNAPETL